MSNNVLDLDILRPDDKLIKIGGNKVNVGFLPLALTWEISDIQEELSKYTAKQIQSDQKIMKVVFNLAVKMCATFCGHQFPELDEDWFQNNTTMGQIQSLVEPIKDALDSSMKGIEEYPGNPEAVGK